VVYKEYKICRKFLMTGHSMIYGEGQKFVLSGFYDSSYRIEINTSETTIDAILVDAEGKKTLH
jgi:hypothetical protein